MIKTDPRTHGGDAGVPKAAQGPTDSTERLQTLFGHEGMTHGMLRPAYLQFCHCAVSEAFVFD